MHQAQTTTAFSSEDQVRDVALRLSHMSEIIHLCLRQIAATEKSNSSAVYALLTEEYALRARANILLVEPKRFTRSEFPATQEEILAMLDGLEKALASAWSSDQITRLIIGLMLFSNAIGYTNARVIALLLEDLKELVHSWAN